MFAQRLFSLYTEVAATPILFHFTNLYAAEKILKSGRFTLTPAEASKVESKLTPGAYYLSTGRSPINDYTRHQSSGVLFVLDGSALSHKYKIAPLDYWQSGPTKSETEDRVLSNSPKVPTRYVTEVRAFGLKSVDDVRIFSAAKKNGVKARFFKSLTHAALGKKDYKPGLTEVPQKQSEGPTYGLLALKPYTLILNLSVDKLRLILSQYKKEIKQLQDARSALYEADKHEEAAAIRRKESALAHSKAGKLVSRINSLVDAGAYSVYFSDAVQSLSADMTNARSPDHRDRENLENLVLYMRKHKIKDTRGLLAALVEKVNSL